VKVEASSFEVELQTSDQVRGANFSENTVSSLPITGLDSLTLAQLASRSGGFESEYRELHQPGWHVCFCREWPAPPRKQFHD